jgi:hypothetical protein
MEKQTFRPAINLRIFHGIAYGMLIFVVFYNSLNANGFLFRLFVGSAIFVWWFSVVVFNRVVIDDEGIVIYRFFFKNSIAWGDVRKMKINKRFLRRSIRVRRNIYRSTVVIRANVGGEDRDYDLSYCVDMQKKFGEISRKRFLATPFARALKKKSPNIF